MTFTTSDWLTTKAVILVPVQDDNTINEVVTITHETSSVDPDYNYIEITDVNGIVTPSFTITMIDDDMPGVTVSETSLMVTEEDTAGDTYTLVLTTQPGDTETATITPSSTNDKLMFNPTSVSFDRS